MKKAKYLTTGEFAKLCRTTKETLFHYDREGLLKPRHVSENGYRRYGVEQFFDFDLIAMLKDTGSSLKEIKQLIFNADAEEFLELLSEKQRIVKRERARLAQRQRMLEDMAALTRDALDAAHDILEVLEQEEVRLEALPTRLEGQNSTADFVDRFLEYSDYFEDQGRLPRQPFGALVLARDVAAGCYKESFFISPATSATPRSHLFIKPKGRYAAFSHRGVLQSHLETYRGMLRAIAAAGLEVSGNAYIFDMMSYIMVGAGDEYIARYCIQVG